MINNIINTEFRTFSMSSKYPFSDISLMQDMSGRDIPYSIFIDMKINTIEQTSSVYISRIFIPSKKENEHLDSIINKLCIEFSGDNGILGYAYNVQTGSSVIVAGPYYARESVPTNSSLQQNMQQRRILKDDTVIGTIVVSDNISYLASLASIQDLTFEPNGLEVHPSRVYSIPLFSQSLAINGMSIPINAPVTFNFLSKRFVLTSEDGADDGYISLNYTVTGSDFNTNTIKTINGHSFKNNKAILLSNNRNNNIRFSIKDQGIYILKVGDDI